MNSTEKAVEVAEKAGSALASLIPQLFFDIIARIIPGCVISVLFGILALSHWQKLPEWCKDGKVVNEHFLNEHFLLFLLVFIAIIYIVSVMFYGIWAFLMHSVYNFVVMIDRIIVKITTNWEPNNFFKKLVCSIRRFFDGLFVEVVEACPEFSFRHDYIKLNAPIAGSRMTKLKAEIHMSGSLAAVFVIGLALSLYFSKNSWIAILLFFAALGCFFSNRHFTRRLHRSVNSYSALLGYPTNKKHSYPEYNIHQTDASVCKAKQLRLPGF
jgi:hypothetical protein